MLAMLVPRKCVGSTWIGSRSKDHPSIHEYIMDWGNSQFFYTHDQPHFSQDTNNPCESLNGRMRLKTDLEESIRNSNCYNIIHRFIVLALPFSLDQTIGVKSVSICDLIPNPNQMKFHHPILLGVSPSAKPFLE